MKRRAFLIATTALAGCNVTTNGSSTTVTINVSQAVAWGTAFVNAAGILAQIAGIAGTPFAQTFTSVIQPALLGALNELNAATNGTVSLTVDKASPQAFLQSMFNNASTLLSTAKTALPNVAPTALTTAQTYVSALQTLVSVFGAAIGQLVPTAGAGGGMDEGEALKLFNVKA